MRSDRHRFLGRAADNHRKTPVLDRVDAPAVVDGVAKLRLYDPIDSWGGDWGVSAKEFATALDNLGDDVTEIRLHINSPGGEVFEGIAILNALRAHKARIVTIVDGLAASAASFIAMAGDEVVMAGNTELMIHDAWGITIGNAGDMRDMASRLDQLSDNIAAVYAEKAGGTVEDWRAAMTAESWYSADEAVAAGLADRVDAPAGDAGDAGAQAKNRFDLSFFNYAGRAAAPPPTTPQTPAAARVGSTTTSQEGSPAVAFSDEQLTTLRQQVGVPADADEATILDALTEALAERADPAAQTTTTTTPAPGTVVLDEAQYAQLLAGNADGRAARAQQLAEDRERKVSAAIQDGRIPPARKEAWLAMLETDPGSAEVLANLKPGLVPMDAIGHALDGADDVEESDDAGLAALLGIPVEAFRG